MVRFGEASLILMSFDDMPVAHWTLASLRRVRAPGGDRAALSLTPEPDDAWGDADGDESLLITDPEMIRAIEEVCADLDRRPSRLPMLMRLFGWFAAAVALGAALVVWGLPWATQRMADLVPPAQERKLGDAIMAQQIAAMGQGEDPVCTSPEGAVALEHLADRLLAGVRLHVPVTLEVIRSPQVNAFAAPGGRVAILSGLLETASGPDEVAAVLAHELGHVAHRDGLRALLRQAGTQGLMTLFMGDLSGGTLAGLTQMALAASYSREMEMEADAFAHDMLADAGLPAESLADFFRKLEGMQGARTEGMARHFASHPDLEARVEAAEAADRLKGSAWKPALEDADWIALKEICAD
ncbi:M48 family metallopeptidase [Albimonas sp. CAU 1670]|uniref:M48 family metallopeptidase n=1 Tax=Albimonas sp. CAU 1670 TaxID=3032599 RepID=UPI0023DB2D58|nr:M48 family metallopeptidase [Albimonas sp. CAU 1670]MDF2233301.1 M48 family metallopeptidase [Albimonas sp. CAU 1670]